MSALLSTANLNSMSKTAAAHKASLIEQVMKDMHPKTSFSISLSAFNREIILNADGVLTAGEIDELCRLAGCGLYQARTIIRFK